MVLRSRMLDQVAIWVSDAPADPFPNLITLEARTSLSSSVSRCVLIMVGIFRVIGFMSPSAHRVLDLVVLNPFEGWWSFDT